MKNTVSAFALTAALLGPAVTSADPDVLRFTSSPFIKTDDSVGDAQKSMMNMLDQFEMIDRIAIDGSKNAGQSESKNFCAPKCPQALLSMNAFIVASANRALIKYAGLSSEQQPRLAKLARKIATRRRTALKHLMERDPREAIRLSLSPGQRQGLPKSILDLLEDRIHAVGDLTQSVTEAPPVTDPQANAQMAPPPPVTSWAVRIGQTTRRAFVYGARLKHQTEFDAPIHGIALDDFMAVDESLLYQYDPFETEQLGFQIGQIVATMGGTPLVLPDLEAFSQLQQELLEQVLRAGPVRFPLTPFDWSVGQKDVLVIKADFSDMTATYYTDAQITAVVEETNDFFEENSQGETSLTATVLPINLALPWPTANYAASGEDWGHARIREDAKDAARDYDMSVGGSGMYDPGEYDRIVILTPQLFDHPIGQGVLGGKSVVISGPRLVFPTLAHELGHTYGFIHSQFWAVPFGADPLGPGTLQEYGDMWDMMGSPDLDRTDTEPQRRHFNAFFKSRAGWLSGAATADGTAGGVFRLYGHDVDDPTGLRAIRIRADDGTWYWLGMRRQFPWNPSMAMGIEVRRVLNDPRYIYGPVQLLDMDSVTPGVTAIEVLHSLVRFETFEDTANHITIRIANVYTDEIGVYADIVITR